MKYIVTDPCYLFTGEHSEWIDFLEATDYAKKLPEGGFKLPVGKITDISNTANGDGGTTLYNHKGEKFEIGVDARLVCIAEVANNYRLPKHGLGALTHSKEQAEEWFSLAMQI